jgi:hypothetical protein
MVVLVAQEHAQLGGALVGEIVREAAQDDASRLASGVAVDDAHLVGRRRHATLSRREGAQQLRAFFF